MLWDFLGTIAVGLGVGACLYALGHSLSRMNRPLPRWAVPVGIGAAMMCFSTWNEYSWFSRVSAQMPEETIVLRRGQVRHLFQPLSYVVPVTSRFAALDPRMVRDQNDGIKVAPILLIERWRSTQIVDQGFDCALGQTRTGQSDWAQAAPGDPAFAAICGE